MTPEQEHLKAEWERAKEERRKIIDLLRDVDERAQAAEKAYCESISEFKVGDYVYDRYGKLFQLTKIATLSNFWDRGALVKKDGTLSKKTDSYVWPPLTKAEKP